jgi:NAD(P)-dependent dehydrogenase (short-subunit alcohol dehydrogenase family)
MNLTQLYDFHEKTALITGASSGLGEQFARCLSDAGARVILAARRINKLKELSNELGNAKAIRMDVTDKNSVISCFSELEKTGEKIDICINNAGIFKVTPVFEKDHKNDFELIMQTNIMGVWYVTKAASNHMKKCDVQGAIINISSVNGANYLQSNRAGYCASKAAVIQMTKALVGELSPHKIRINCIMPGPFHTPATDYKVATQELRENLEASIPLGFFAKPNNLDGLILYLSSNQASKYVTGASFSIDGGISWGGTSSSS